MTRAPLKGASTGWAFIGNIVIHCAGEVWNEAERRMEGTHRDLGEFYAQLLGMSVIRDDWVKVGRNSRTFPQLAIDGIENPAEYRAPAWPDPDRPQQIHLDIGVPDLDVAHSLALELGATHLHEARRHRTYSDSAGHPFCLYADDEPASGTRQEIAFRPEMGEISAQPVGASRARLARVVLDCGNARELARFYGQLLGMRRRRRRDEPELVISRDDDMGLEIGFQQVDGYVPPRYGDDHHHQQLHLDIWFEDPNAAQELAESLGAVRLPHPHLRVFADPAGHPFCLLGVGQ